jgi:hypothetical protein
MSLDKAKINNSLETKRSRFIRVAEARVNRILDGLDSLGKCSNRSNYEYSEEDLKKIFGEIDRKVRDTKTMFQGTSKNKTRFKLEG